MATVYIFFALTTGFACAAKISGIVTDSSGARIYNASVSLYLGGPLYALAQDNPTATDITGYYEFSLLPAGVYSVQAEKGGYFSDTGMVDLGAGDAVINLLIRGYKAQASLPPLPPTLSLAPTSVPMPTYATPTPTPRPRPSNTPVPLPSPTPSPGFELLLALAATSAAVAVRSRK